MDEIKLDRRNHLRFKREVNVKYFLKNHSSKYQECTTIDISRSGIGIQFDKFEALTIGSKILLEIFLPQSLKQVNVIGEIKWIEQKENNIICGVRFDEMLDQTTFAEFI